MESATLTADLLLSHILGSSRVRVLTCPDIVMPAEALERFQALIRRRAQGVPLQYLTGEQEFFGLSFRVAPDVLIPRPETEILVEHAVRLARNRQRQPLRFADVGTGSGCIAIAVAHEISASIGYALDISPAALGIARENSARHALLGRIHFLCSDVLEGILPNPLFDLILSNPPYVADSEYNTLPAMVRDHEPHTALFAGRSGLEIYRQLVPQSAARLLPGGHLVVEIGLGQAAAVKEMLEQGGFSVESVLSDLQGILRCVVARKAR